MGERTWTSAQPEVNTMFTRRRPIFAQSKGLALSTAERGVVRDY
nr:hypothetical protein [Desulforamulus aquiferis]